MKPACLLAIPALALPACSPESGASTVPIQESSRTQAGYRLETVAEGLEVPWAMDWAPDGRLFFTERPGRIRVIKDGRLDPKPVLVLDDVSERSESGLMGLVLHPDFAKNRWMYFAYTYRPNRVQVVRVRETGGSLSDRRVILDEIPAAPNHAGCRLRFGPDRKLYVTTGDATDARIAQQLSSLGGKILRLNDDGSVPSNNPFVGRSGARDEIWAYGSRNAQGIAWQPGTNLLFETEHGPSGFDGPGGGDEVNIIEKGGNYGWPVVMHEQSREGMAGPIALYTPAQAPASAAFYTGSMSGWKGSFFFGALRGQGLMRLELDGRRVARQEKLFAELGRCREVAMGPDGHLYFSTSNRDGRGRPAASDDRIFRIVPR